MGANINKFDAWLKEAKRLRTALTHAEFDFFTHLRKGEVAGIIAGTKYVNFTDMLRGTNICDPTRFEKFKTAVETFGASEVREIGLDGVNEVLRIPVDAISISSPGSSARTIALKEVKEFERKHHVPVSRQHAETIVKKHFIPQKTERAPADNTPRTPLEKALDKENRRLKSELRSANRKIADLEAKLQKAEAKLQKAAA